jgi:hypothetical protein
LRGAFLIPSVVRNRREIGGESTYQECTDQRKIKKKKEKITKNRIQLRDISTYQNKSE